MAHVIRDGQRVAFATRGSGRETVLLAHNLMSGRGSFAAVAERLAERCRVLAVDLRGHGESGGARRGFSAQDLAEDLRAVLDEAGVTRALLVGTSPHASTRVEDKRTVARVRMGHHRRGGPGTQGRRAAGSIEITAAIAPEPGRPLGCRRWRRV